MPTESIRDGVKKHNPEKDILAVLQHISDGKSAKTCCCSHRNEQKSYGQLTLHKAYSRLGYAAELFTLRLL